MTQSINYKEAHDLFIWNYRIDYDPVGIKFISDEKIVERLKTTHKPKSKLSFCQFAAAARSSRMELFMRPDDLSCRNGQISMGFKKPERDRDPKAHLKYTMNEELAWDVVSVKDKLTGEAASGVYFAQIGRASCRERVCQYV